MVSDRVLFSADRNRMVAGFFDVFVVIQDQIFWYKDVVLLLDGVNDFLSRDALIQVPFCMRVPGEGH